MTTALAILAAFVAGALVDHYYGKTVTGKLKAWRDAKRKQFADKISGKRD